MNLPTNDQVSAALRHVGTAGATTVGVFAVLGILSPDQVAAVIADIHQITDGLQQTFGGVSKIIIIVGPIAATYFAKGAVMAAGLRRQLKAITNNPDVKIQGQIVVPAPVAKDVPSTQVVSPQEANR